MSFATEAPLTRRTRARTRRGSVLGLACLLWLPLMPPGLRAQQRPLSPSGASAAQLGGTFDVRAGNVGGKWIDIRYGRPLKRGRDLFGLPDWKEALNDGADIWRAGANYTTVLTTEVALEIGGVAVPPGEYTVFIDLQDASWTFVLSRWAAQTTYDYENKEALFGAYYYTPEKDLLRTPMKVRDGDVSFEQLSWQFADIGDGRGTLVLLWDQKVASVEFRYAP